MTQRTSWMAPTRRLGLTTITVRNAWQRLSMTLMLVMLTTMTAWAADVNLTEDTGATAGTALSHYR